MAERTRYPILIAGLVSLGVSGGGLLWMQQHLERALAVRPPVVVLDPAGAARAVDPDRLKRRLEDYRLTAEQLSDQGLLVLDGQAVLAAPAGLSLADSEVRHAGP